MSKGTTDHMESSQTSMPLSSLLCEEDESCFNQHNDKDANLDQCSITYSDGYIEMLIDKETKYQCTSNVCSSDCSVKMKRSWLKCARLDAIQWIFNTRDFFGFHFRTAYLSLIYFDRFFSRRSIDDGKFWAIRLLSVACLSLAAKMEECKVPLLSEYHIDDYNFEGNVIQRMELLVLDTLDWKMSLVTPFAYLHYFIIKFCAQSRPKELISKAIELTMAIVKEINMVEHPPSIIAAAAVLAAYDYQLTREVVDNMTSLIALWGSREKEIEVAKFNTPQTLSPLDLSLTHSSGRLALENSSITSTVGTKRRLTYSDCNHHCPLQRIHRS